MTTFWFCVHIAASLGVGIDAQRRGRSFIVWTSLTLIPYGIFVTLPLLYILPRLTPLPDIIRTGAQAEPTVAGQKLLSQLFDPHPTPTSNKSFYMGVTVWVVCLIVVGMAVMVRP